NMSCCDSVSRPDYCSPAERRRKVRPFGQGEQRSVKLGSSACRRLYPGRPQRERLAGSRVSPPFLRLLLSPRVRLEPRMAARPLLPSSQPFPPKQQKVPAQLGRSKQSNVSCSGALGPAPNGVGRLWSPFSLARKG